MLTTCATAVLGVALSAAAPAVEVRQGQSYPGETQLEATDLGVAFTIPAGWRGAWPQGSEAFVLQPEADPAVYILALGEEASRAELRQMMGAAVDLGDGVTLHPTAAVVDRGPVLVGRYSVSGAQRGLLAYAEALTGEHGTAVAYVLIAPAGSLARHEPAVEALVASTRLDEPGATGSVAGAASADAGDRWDAYLKGKYIVRYYTGSGYTEEEHLWLCSDGSFRRSTGSGGFGGGASGAFQGSGGGRWTATGAGARGSLTLHWGDGSTSSYDLRWDYDENHLYVDGKRWFHDQNQVCN